MLNPSDGFDELYAAHAHRVRGLVRKLVGDRDLAEDIVQETFLRAYRRGLHHEGAGDDDHEAAWPWLAAVGRRLAVDSIRHQAQRRVTTLAPALRAPDPRPAVDPHIMLTRAGRHEAILDALTALPARHRRVLLMKDLEGRQCDEIAALEGVSVRALKSVLARARYSFRAHYTSMADHRGLRVALLSTVVREARSRIAALRHRVTSAGARMGEGVGGAVRAAVATPVALSSLAMGGLVAAVLGAAVPGTRHDARADRPTAVAVAATATPPGWSGSGARGLAPRHDDDQPAVETAVVAPPRPTATTSHRVEAGSGAVGAPGLVGAGAGVEHHDDGSTRVTVDDHAGTGGDRPPETEGERQAWIECPPPEERGVAKTVACPLLAGLGDAPTPDR